MDPQAESPQELVGRSTGLGHVGPDENLAQQVSEPGQSCSDRAIQTTSHPLTSGLFYLLSFGLCSD